VSDASDAAQGVPFVSVWKIARSLTDLEWSLTNASLCPYRYRVWLEKSSRLVQDLSKQVKDLVYGKSKKKTITFTIEQVWFRSVFCSSDLKERRSYLLWLQQEADRELRAFRGVTYAIQEVLTSRSLEFDSLEERAMQFRKYNYTHGYATLYAKHFNQILEPVGSLVKDLEKTIEERLASRVFTLAVFRTGKMLLNGYLPMQVERLIPNYPLGSDEDGWPPFPESGDELKRDHRLFPLRKPVENDVFIHPNWVKKLGTKLQEIGCRTVLPFEVTTQINLKAQGLDCQYKEFINEFERELSDPQFLERARSAERKKVLVPIEACSQTSDSAGTPDIATESGIVDLAGAASENVPSHSEEKGTIPSWNRGKRDTDLSFQRGQATRSTSHQPAACSERL